MRSGSQSRLRVGLLLLVVALAVAAAVTYLGEPRLDRQLVNEAIDLRDGAFGEVMRWASQVGYVRILGPVALVIALVYGAALRRWRDALLIAVTTFGAAILNAGVKQVFDRARPDSGVDLLAAGFSMPSGHAAASSAFALSLVLATHPGRRRRIVLVCAVAFALLVGLSRVVSGVHYPTDVLAGWSLGSGVALVLADLLRHRSPRVALGR